MIRTNTRYSAKSDWYDWKLQWVEGLRITAEEAFKSLKKVRYRYLLLTSVPNFFLCFKDARTLEELIRSADGLIPELEQEYQSLTEELEREQAEVAEIESGDQDYLNELKATVAEQKYVGSGHNFYLIQNYTCLALRLKPLKLSFLKEKINCGGCKNELKSLMLRSARQRIQLLSLSKFFTGRKTRRGQRFSG